MRPEWLFLITVVFCFAFVLLYASNPFLLAENEAERRSARSVGETVCNVWIIDANTVACRFTPMDWVVVCTPTQMWLYADISQNTCAFEDSYVPARELRSGKDRCIPKFDIFMSDVQRKPDHIIRVPDTLLTVYDMMNYVIKYLRYVERNVESTQEES